MPFLYLLRRAALLAALLPAACGSDTTSTQPPAIGPPALHTAQAVAHPWRQPFGYGCNLGYYGQAWTDEQLATAVREAGGTTLRVSLPEQFLAQWGYDARRPAFRLYADSLHFSNLLCFVGEPSPAHRDPITYPGSPEQSKLFDNLYEPVWLPDSTVNPRNYYATYLREVLQRYGQHVRVWEIVNEPDYITGTTNSEWLKRPPTPAELPNLRAPIYRYIRMLRISWEVVKHYRPDAYVTPGGLGYPEYLDALLRYTDNPHDGSVTREYPVAGGAYFDLLAYHVYPAYDLRRRSWQRAGTFAYTRTSDYAAQQVLVHQQAMQAVLEHYGYNGRQYPRKSLLVSEVNVSRRPVEWRTSSDEMQRNFGLKALVLAQQAGLGQLHFYRVGEGADAPSPGTPIAPEQEFELMGLYENLQAQTPGRQQLTQLGQALRTAGTLLAGHPYDAAATAALRLPPGVGGAAFGPAGRGALVLWAKATTDESEQAEATYTLPAAWPAARLRRYEWNHKPGTPGQPCPSAQLTLSAAPSLLKLE